MLNLSQDYTNSMLIYEKQLNNDYKKCNGIFYTDLFLANRIIEELDIPIDATVLDPCCGTGSFIIASLQKGIQFVYGADLDENAIMECSKYSNGANIIVADTVGYEGIETLKKLKMLEKADFIVGNPPYAPIINGISINAKDYLFLRKVSNSGNNLFIAALLRAFEMLKQGGVISYIIPKNFLHVVSYKLLRHEILKEKTIISIVDIGAYFKNVRGEQIILTISNGVPKNNYIRIKKLINGEFLDMTSVNQAFYTDEILLFNSDEEFSIYNKLKSSYQMLNDVCTGYLGRGRSRSDDAINGKDIRKFGYKKTPLPKNGNRILIQNIYSAEAGIIAAFGGNLEAAETVTVFTDGDEKMCRYILGILHTRLCNFFLYKFCYNNSKLTMHTDAKYLKKIPLSIKDENNFNKILEVVYGLEKAEYMSDEWYDLLELLNMCAYKAYGITENESKLIDYEMKNVQSKRWLKHGRS